MLFFEGVLFMFTLRISFCRLLSFFVLCLLAVVLLAACALPWKHHTASALPSSPTAQQLLSTLQKNFRNVSTFHVVMQVQNPGQAVQDQVQIRSANGDVSMPDKVKAQATVMLSGQPVTVNLISIGANQFITDPVTGQWRVIKGVLDPRTLTNPNTGLLSLIGKLHNVSRPVSDSTNGTPCWRITGQLAAKDLAFFTGGGVPPTTMLKTSACVGKADALPYQLVVTGQAARGDTAQTARTFQLSHYNESVTIQAPQV
jgi:LppX_LprAFG lipoprotein